MEQNIMIVNKSQQIIKKYIKNYNKCLLLKNAVKRLCRNIYFSFIKVNCFTYFIIFLKTD